MTQTALRLSGLRRAPHGGTQASLGTLEVPPPSNARLCAIPSLLGRDKAQVILVACGEGVAGTGELAQKVEQVFRKVTKGPASLQVAQGTQCLGLSWGF